MPDITEGDLVFEFPDGWRVSQYDKSAFHRRFQKIQDGVKALDIIAIDPNRVCWLLEIKDYRVHPRAKAANLADEVAGKVIGSLASLLPAKLYADDPEEQSFAAAVLKAKKLRVALHLEQPRHASRLFPQSVDPVDVLQKLRGRLKPVDAHPVVCRGNDGHGWRVRPAPRGAAE